MARVRCSVTTEITLSREYILYDSNKCIRVLFGNHHWKISMINVYNIIIVKVERNIRRKRYIGEDWYRADDDAVSRKIPNVICFSDQIEE